MPTTDEFSAAEPPATGPDVADKAVGLASFASLADQLKSALLQLESLSRPLQLRPLGGREWYDLLIRKLLPQLTDDAFLIVAVVGGTNIGKSVVFNHIAGFRASASSPLASGTKHPVCLIPDQFDQDHDLGNLFPQFELRSWVGGDEALKSYEEDCLFWRTSDSVAPNLVILDTPDVDSDAPVNWRRADAVRQAADVLVAVLTQQKYNDAAVKQFFRKAAAEDKAALVVFNQVELPDDEPYWPLWLKTFCDETGLKPEYVYLAPNDRKAAEAIQLRFEERAWPQLDQRRESDLSNHATISLPSQGYTNGSLVSLNAVLSQMRFSEIKLRTLRGSLNQVISPSIGAPEYLSEILLKSQQFQAAAKVFADRGLIQHANWPAPPNSLLVEEMWVWWNNHREAWTSRIHGLYSAFGQVMSSGLQHVRNRIWGEPKPPLDDYRKAEWDAIVRVLEQVYERLRIIATLDNPILSSRLDTLLAGTSCESVIEKLRQEHESFQFSELISSLVDVEMSGMRDGKVQLFQILRNADRAAAVARPALTLLLFLGGAVGAEQMLMHAATQSMAHVAVDATAAAGTTLAGEVVVETASGVIGQAKTHLLKLHEKFKNQREAWLVVKLREYLLGDLVEELQLAASIPNSSAYADVERVLRQFEDQMNQVVCST